MRKIFVTRRLPSNILKIVQSAGFTIDMWDDDDPVDYNYMTQQSSNVEGLICTLSDNINEEFIKNAKSLKVISSVSVGLDHIDIKAAKSRNIRIGYTPYVLTDATAELAVALLLMVSRKLNEGIENVKLGKWTSWKPFWMCGQGLANSTVGIVGIGEIGMAIARRLSPFNVDTFLGVGSGRPKSAEQLKIDEKKSIVVTEFPELLNKSDFVIAVCSLNPSTTGMFNKSAFSQMKKSGIFINISRGPVVDQDALYNALVHEEIAAAGLDVCTPEPLPTEHKLLSLKNCVILPHIGSATYDTREKMAHIAVQNLLQGLKGDEMISEMV